MGLGVHGHIVPTQALALRHRAHHLDAMRQAQWQAAHAQRGGGRQQFAPHGVATLAVQNFPRFQVAFGRGHHIGMPARGHPGGLATQGDTGHAHPHLQADQMPALVQGEVAPTGVGVGVVFLKTVADVFGLTLHRDPHTHADVVGNFAAIGLQAGDHLDHAFALEHAALADGARHIGDVFHAGGWVKQSIAGHAQARGIGDGRALDRGLGAVQKAVEHLGVQPATHRLLRGQAVVAPHRLGRGLGKVRQPFVAATGRHDGEATGAGPIHQVANQRRLVAKRQRVNHASRLGAGGQQGATKRIGLHGHIDHMLAVCKGFQNMVHRVQGGSRALDHHINGWVAHQSLPILGHMGGAEFHGLIQRLGLQAFRFPAHAGQVGLNTRWGQIGNAHQMHARGARHLGQVHGAKFASTNQTDADGPLAGRALEQFGMQVHAVTAKSSVEVCKALAGMPFFQGTSTG